jgi:restriction system protein
MQPGSVSSDQALAALRSQIQDRLEDVQEAVKQAVDLGQYVQAQAALQDATALTGLLKDLDAWAERFAGLISPPAEDLSPGDAERLRKGLKTPQSAYRVPILRAIVALGGEGQIGAVLAQVYEEMKERLNAHDLGTLSDGKTLRWRNTAQWTRNSMREEGLIRDDSAYGIWAISEKGRQWLARQSRQA